MFRIWYYLRPQELWTLITGRCWHVKVLTCWWRRLLTALIQISTHSNLYWFVSQDSEVIVSPLDGIRCHVDEDRTKMLANLLQQCSSSARRIAYVYFADVLEHFFFEIFAFLKLKVLFLKWCIYVIFLDSVCSKIWIQGLGLIYTVIILIQGSWEMRQLLI